MNYILCRGPAPVDGLRCRQCDAEYDKRMSAGTCVIGGEVDANRPNHFCDACKNDVSRGWRGYPGGD